MLSLPDFKEKKVLYIWASKDMETQLKFGNSNLRLYKDGKLSKQISLFSIVAIFIIGEFTITSHLIRKFKECGITVFFLNNSFKYYAGIFAEAEGNTELRALQYRMNEEQELEFSKILLRNKIVNQYKLLSVYKKEMKSDIKSYELAIKMATKNDRLLGLEGLVAKEYYKLLFAKYDWYRRAPTTKEDINNMLLDIGYTFLFNIVDSLLRLFGFDTYKGFYHKLYFQRKSLSCDVMEPLRVLIDKALAKAYALNRINEKDFTARKGYYEFKDWEVGKKYTQIFSEIILDNKEEIYKYVLSWYRYYHNQEKYRKPKFTVRL